MKHLLFFLFLIPVMSFGQTANYTSLSSTDLEVYSVSDKTLVYEFYDTLSGSNDTLIISFPKEFAVDYTATLGSTWVSTGTTTDSDVFLQGRNASHETWTDLGTTTFAAETTTAYSDGIDVGGYLYYRLVCVSASGNAHLKNTLVLKKKVGSSASAGGGASYLVYTALINQSGTDDPTAVVLENTLGFTVYFDRTIAGTYNVMCDNNVLICTGFPFGRTFGFTGGVSDDVIFGGRAKFIEADESYWQLFIYDNSGALTDDGMVMMPLELRVYPE